MEGSMEYSVYKLKFKTGVHFSNGFLNDSEYILRADTIFSALCIEAKKNSLLDEFVSFFKEGRLLISDALPYIDDTLFVPKPMIYIEGDNRGDSVQKKKHKKMKYIPVEAMDDFVSGSYLGEGLNLENFGKKTVVTRANVRNEENTLPYHVGVFNFFDKNTSDRESGLYIILGYRGDEEKYMFEDIMDSLSYSGIGGKVSSGLGKFSLIPFFKAEKLTSRINNPDYSLSMTLSISLPKKGELDNSLEEASYIAIKRSGFINSNELNIGVKKKNLFMFQSGSCFKNIFEGDIYDVAPKDIPHPVYRYGKAIFLGVK